MTPRAPEPDDGPRRFMHNWLTFDEHAPSRIPRLWKLLATVVILLVASAMLVLFSDHLPR